MPPDPPHPPSYPSQQALGYPAYPPNPPMYPYNEYVYEFQAVEYAMPVLIFIFFGLNAIFDIVLASKACGSKPAPPATAGVQMTSDVPVAVGTAVQSKGFDPV